MRTAITGGAAVAAVAWAMLFAGGAHAATACGEPAESWQRVSPAEAGMDGAKLQDAMDYGTSQLGFALRVYRRGCLVAEDRLAAHNREQRFESYSMAKSVTSLLFGRAMALGLISPDDPAGALVGEADRPHGEIAMRDLLTMTSGLRWNGFRDYNVFTMRDSVRDALTNEVVHRPGTYFEYAQTAVALLAEAIGRAVREDPEAFAQRELMGPLGIADQDWSWVRDAAGHVQGFSGVEMRPDDFARLGELLRRGGVWRGRRLLARRYLAGALTPSRTNGCYAWLIWVNAGAPCVGPTITERPVSQGRDFPDLPADMYQFAGLFGQRVTVFPSQELLVVRLGQDPGLTGGEWEHELYRRVLGAVADQRIEAPGEPPRGERAQEGHYGFQDSATEPDQYGKGLVQDPLPPAGPERARAARLALAHPRARRDGTVTIRLTCPARWLGPSLGECAGEARLEGARKAVRYSAGAGHATLLRFRLSPVRLGALKRAGSAELDVVALNRDLAGGTPARAAVTVKGPKS